MEQKSNFLNVGIHRKLEFQNQDIKPTVKLSHVAELNQ